MAFGIDDAVAVGLKLIDKWFPSQAEKDKAKLDLLQMQQAGEFKWLEALNKSDEGQVSINVEEAKSDSLFKSGWRPYIGWVCGGGLSYQLLIHPIGSWVAGNCCGWQPMPSLEMDTLMALLFGLLGLGAYRTYEKVKGKA